MNQKQEKFCRAYLKTLNISKAAKEVGYSPSSGYKLIKHNNEVSSYIEAELEQIKDDDMATVEEIIKMLTETMRNTKHEIVYRLKAAELLGKVNGIFKGDTSMQQQVIIIDETGIAD